MIESLSCGMSAACLDQTKQKKSKCLEDLLPVLHWLRDNSGKNLAYVSPLLLSDRFRSTPWRWAFFLVANLLAEACLEMHVTVKWGFKCATWTQKVILSSHA